MNPYAVAALKAVEVLAKQIENLDKTNSDLVREVFDAVKDLAEEIEFLNRENSDLTRGAFMSSGTGPS